MNNIGKISVIKSEGPPISVIIKSKGPPTTYSFTPPMLVNYEPSLSWQHCHRFSDNM